MVFKSRDGHGELDELTFTRIVSVATFLLGGYGLYLMLTNPAVFFKDVWGYVLFGMTACTVINYSYLCIAGRSFFQYVLQNRKK
ncbi:hypothetical protein ATL39_0160 [Sinobaca qinghaiensis]|uniref:Uncharacterized protein n=1 Tax=Sinobaca qinghaiensis TaxID=342944 RepID=A0A419V7D4_9BACL|nr:hypothetical protein [Sinobaca qinghaiensis]RKD75950.1 hypothetical protein ATL39_0160 [Sinobaca qinghaiensis]